MTESTYLFTAQKFNFENTKINKDPVRHSYKPGEKKFKKKNNFQYLTKKCDSWQ